MSQRHHYTTASAFAVVLLLCSGATAFPELMKACELGPATSLGGPHKQYSERDDMLSMAMYVANTTEITATVEPGQNYTLTVSVPSEGCGSCIVSSEGARLVAVDFFYTDSPISCNGTRVDYHNVPVEVSFLLFVDNDTESDVMVTCDFVPGAVQHTAYLSTMTLPLMIGDER